MNYCEYLIKKLNLIPHPEGGHFAESFRDADGSISLIYYLLKKGESSHWHKLTKNEIIHFYDGDPLIVFLSKDKFNTKKIILGRNLKKGEYFHYTVKSETWFGMCSKGEWSLVGCTVAPAFNYKDFELAPLSWSPSINKKKIR